MLEIVFFFNFSSYLGTCNKLASPIFISAPKYILKKSNISHFTILILVICTTQSILIVGIYLTSGQLIDERVVDLQFFIEICKFIVIGC